jgi:hypothetical protein
MKTCGPRINQTERTMVFLPNDDPRRPQIARELALARSAMEQGNGQGCMNHVGNAAGMEQ